MTRYLKAIEIGTGGAHTLPAAAYTSPEVYQQELERIFSRCWVCVARESELPQPGAYVQRTVGSESLLLVRDAAGRIRAFYNVCRHRGTRLCEQPQGRFAKTIQCPYHAWTYGLDGQLLGAPSMESLGDFRHQDYPLHSAATATWEGFIFASLSPQPEPFAVSYAPLMERFARFNLSGLQSERQIQYDVQANWKLIVENYSECYHCPSVHPSLAALSPSDSGENDLISGPFLGGFSILRRPGTSLTRSGKPCARPVGDLPPEDLQRVYYYALFPNLLLSLHPDYVMFHRLWPLAPDRTLIDCVWLFHGQASQDDMFDPEDAVSFWDETNRQDWHMCELCQQGVRSRAYVPGPYSPRESLSAAFDRHWQSVMTTGE